MKVIYRRTGNDKTIDTILACAKDNGYIVCFNREEADRVHKLSAELGLNIPLPITFNDFLGQRYNVRGVKNFYIDNVDMCLQSISSVPIKLLTATKDD